MATLSPLQSAVPRSPPDPEPHPTPKQHHEIARPEFYQSPALYPPFCHSFLPSPAREVRKVHDNLHDFRPFAYHPNHQHIIITTQRPTRPSPTPTPRPDQPRPSLTYHPTLPGYLPIVISHTRPIRNTYPVRPSTHSNPSTPTTITSAYQPSDRDPNNITTATSNETNPNSHTSLLPTQHRITLLQSQSDNRHLPHQPDSQPTHGNSANFGKYTTPTTYQPTNQQSQPTKDAPTTGTHRHQPSPDGLGAELLPSPQLAFRTASRSDWTTLYRTLESYDWEPLDAAALDLDAARGTMS